MPTSKTLCAFDAVAGRPPAAGYAQLDLRNGNVVLDFDEATNESIDFVAVLPRAYAGSDLEVVVTWAATSATTGDVVWQAAFERHPIGDATHGTHALDGDDFGTAATATGAAPSGSGELVRTAIALAAVAADSPQGGESFRVRVSRSATDIGDTLLGDAELLTVEVREV